MSLTNPNKVVTEQRLSEFYQEIKPYMGTNEMPSEDMSEVISPLPSVQSRYHKYSTEEQVVGEWIDGKPLYQITYVATFSNKAVGQRFYVKLADMSNVEYVSANGMIKFNETGEIYSVCTYATDKFQGVSDSNSAYSVWNADGSSHGVVVKQNFVNGNASGTVKVTILYTKTTD